MKIHTVIFGGGAAGLWLLDELRRRGIPAVLLEAGTLGAGQTVASQGILHGGLKYTLQGVLTASAQHISDMPAYWRECLNGQRPPELTDTPLRSNCCYLWRTGNFTSRLGMMGARFGLRVAPTTLSDNERPAVLRQCPGTVARLDEQVISPAGLLANLSCRNREAIVKINAAGGVHFDWQQPGVVRCIRLTNPDTQYTALLQPENVVLTAGAGNAALREQLGLSPAAMQRRPLHMVVLRGPLPVLNGHCIDGRTTRVTMTSDTDAAGRTVWQIGGQLAEDGVHKSPAELLQHAAQELRATLPGINLGGVEGTTYRVNRAEAATRNGKRPAMFHTRREGNVITAWPTKLVLVPRLAESIADGVAEATPQSVSAGDDALTALHDWPKPQLAAPPWETITTWQPVSGGAARGDAAA